MALHFPSALRCKGVQGAVDEVAQWWELVYLTCSVEKKGVGYLLSAENSSENSVRASFNISSAELVKAPSA